MLTLVDRYVSRLFWTYFLSGLLVFVTLFLSVDATSLTVRYDIPLNVLLSYYTYMLPSVLYQMIPAACLVGTIFTLGTMGRSNELTALFSVGMSLARISGPILGWVVVICVLNFGINDRLVPIFSKKKNFVFYSEIEKKPWLYSTVKTNKIWYRSQNILFNIRTLNPDTRVAQDVQFYYFDNDWNLVELITAKELHIKDGTRWDLQSGTVTLFVAESSFPLTKTFDTKTITINETVGDLQTSAKTSETLAASELNRFIKKNKDAGLDTLRYEVDFHAKYSFAFAGFVMAFIGIPFSVFRARASGWALNVGATLGLAFFYWALYSSGLTLGRHGILPPLISAWSANVAILLATLGFLLRLRR